MGLKPDHPVAHELHDLLIYWIADRGHALRDVATGETHTAVTAWTRHNTSHPQFYAI